MNECGDILVQSRNPRRPYPGDYCDPFMDGGMGGPAVVVEVGMGGGGMGYGGGVEVVQEEVVVEEVVEVVDNGGYGGGVEVV